MQRDLAGFLLLLLSSSFSFACPSSIRDRLHPIRLHTLLPFISAMRRSCSSESTSSLSLRGPAFLVLIESSIESSIDQYVDRRRMQLMACPQWSLNENE